MAQPYKHFKLCFKIVFEQNGRESRQTLVQIVTKYIKFQVGHRQIVVVGVRVIVQFLRNIHKKIHFMTQFQMHYL